MTHCTAHILIMFQQHITDNIINSTQPRTLIPHCNIVPLLKSLSRTTTTNGKGERERKKNITLEPVFMAKSGRHMHRRAQRRRLCYGEFLFIVISARTMLGLVSNLVFIGHWAPAAPFMIISLTNNEYLLSWTIVSNRCRAANLIRDKDL